jgi:hypothetical protein
MDKTRTQQDQRTEDVALLYGQIRELNTDVKLSRTLLLELYRTVRTAIMESSGIYEPQKGTVMRRVETYLFGETYDSSLEAIREQDSDRGEPQSQHHAGEDQG